MLWAKKAFVVVAGLIIITLLSLVCFVFAYLAYWGHERERNAAEAQQAIKRDCGLELTVASEEFGDYWYTYKKYKREDGSILYITCNGNTEWQCTCSGKP